MFASSKITQAVNSLKALYLLCNRGFCKSQLRETNIQLDSHVCTRKCKVSFIPNIASCLSGQLCMLRHVHMLYLESAFEAAAAATELLEFSFLSKLFLPFYLSYCFYMPVLFSSPLFSRKLVKVFNNYKI